MIKNLRKLYIWLIIGFLILIILGAWLWLSRPPLTSAKQAVFKVVPLPMFSVNGKTMTVGEYLNRLQIAQNLSSNKSSVDAQNLQQNLYARLVEEKKLEAIAFGVGAYVPKKQLEREFSERQEAYRLSGGGSLKDQFNKSGLTETQYQEVILKPEILRVNLLIWYNGQKNLNESNYSLAEDLLGRLQKGEKFGDLAKNYSQDPASKNISGDMGYVEINSLLPEMNEDIDALKTDETKIIASRYGLHLVKLLSRDNSGINGGSRIHLNQIFIKTSGFDAWYSNQAKNLKVKTWVKL